LPFSLKLLGLQANLVTKQPKITLVSHFLFFFTFGLLFQIFFLLFYLDNHREYIEKVIKLIAKAKYRDMTKKKGIDLGGKMCYNKNKETT
jgi:hypothetical protein